MPIRALALAEPVNRRSPTSLRPLRPSPTLLFTATQDKLHQPYRGTLMPPSTELIALFRSKGYAAAVSGAGPCVLVLHYGNAREAIDQIASEQLASGHWRVLHLPINTAGVEIERR